MQKPYRLAVMAIIIREDGRFLIGSSPRDEGYKFPQGGIDPGECEIDCLKRELFEELGVQISNDDILAKLPQSVSYPYPDYKPYSKIYFGQSMQAFIVRHRSHYMWQPQDDEFEELHWILPSELHSFDCVYRKTAYLHAITMLQDIDLLNF
jgi:putative (di)nucleoside polyphosphate hydrolase